MRLFFVLILTTAVAFADAPGEYNHDVKQSTLKDTVCVPNWTNTIRPSSYYTNKLKRKQMKELGLKGSPVLYEEDHMIPLSLGGHPTSEKNLWPQLWEGEEGAKVKDNVEKDLHKKLCQNKITLKEARQQIIDWRNYEFDRDAGFVMEFDEKTQGWE